MTPAKRTLIRRRIKIVLLLVGGCLSLMFASKLISAYQFKAENHKQFQHLIAVATPGTPENKQAFAYAEAYRADPKRQAAYNQAVRNMGIRPSTSYNQLMSGPPEPSEFLMPGVSPLGGSTGVETASSTDITKVVPRTCKQTADAYAEAFPYKGDKSLWYGPTLLQKDAPLARPKEELRTGELFEAVMSTETLYRACALMTDRALGGAIYQMKDSFTKNKKIK